MAESQQTFTFSVPLDLNQIDREEIGEMVVEFITNRTRNGKDKDNRNFPKYSESYKSSKDFAIAGKSSTVNLTQTGDMLTDLEVLTTAITGFITIGYEAGTDENDRAAWQRNNLRPTTPKRDFLGISQKDLDKIIRIYRAQNPRTTEADRQTRTAANAILSSFFNNVFNGET